MEGQKKNSRLVFKVGFDRDLTWIISSSDPSVISIDHPHEWEVVNPLVPVEPVILSGLAACKLEDGSTLVSSQELAIFVPEENASNIEHLQSFLTRLRFETGQAGLPLEPLFSMYRDLEHLPPRVQPSSVEGATVVPMPYRYRTAITVDAVVKAGSRDEGAQSVPVYAEMLLDAIESANRLDFQKTILYAAIAVETMAGAYLDSEYERLRQVDPESIAHRFIDQLDGEGKQTVQDPIYQRLQKQRRSGIRSLLHELPFYLMRRSLLRENENLYQQAHRLHKTRNQIVHTASVQEATESLPLSPEGARMALETARQAFEWFGAPGTFMLPDSLGGLSR